MTKTFLPSIHNNAPVAGQGEPMPIESALALLIMAHDDQQRQAMVWHPILEEVARAHCVDMATRRYEGHTDPDGLGPNYRVRQAGYRLPEWYADDLDSNNVESLQWGGDGDLDHAFPSWLGSAPHKTHILGLDSFYTAQTNYGVGCAKVSGSRMIHYYAFISAPPQE